MLGGSIRSGQLIQVEAKGGVRPMKGVRGEPNEDRHVTLPSSLYLGGVGMPMDQASPPRSAHNDWTLTAVDGPVMRRPGRTPLLLVVPRLAYRKPGHALQLGDSRFDSGSNRNTGMV